MKKIKTPVLLGISILTTALLSACVSNPTLKQFKVRNFWVEDTLSQTNVKFRKINRMSPALYKESVIAGNALDGLVSYDAKTKNVNWRLVIENGVEAGAALVRDTLFAGSNDGKMHSVNLINGTINWIFDAKSELVAEPFLDDGILYFISGSQALYALDATSGKQQWLYNRQDTSNSMTVRGSSRPAISNGIIYAGFSDGALVAINAKTGTEQWEITLNRNSRFKDIDSSPVVVDDLLFINSYDDKIYCISKTKGEVLWSSPYGGSSTPLVLGDKIINTSSRGELVALSKADGKLLWKKATTKGMFIDPVAFNEGLIVAAESQGKVLFLSSVDAKEVGSFEPGRGVFSRPTVQGDSVYFISGEGNIYGLEAGYDNKASIYYLK